MQLFELNLGTGDLRQVTRGPDVHPGGCYGPEGRLALVTATVERNRALSRIELTEPGGLDPGPITEGPFDRAVACAPDGSSIAWVADDERGREWIVTRAPVVDGENRRIAPGRAPAYTPDGRWIVYSAPTGRGRELYRIRPDGGGRAPIGRRVGDELQPSVSPDGRLVVYVGEDEYHRRLYVRRIDGTGDRILLESGDGEYPTW
jgi:TolB protein